MIKFMTGLQNLKKKQNVNPRNEGIMVIGGRLKLARKAKNLSLRELADEIGVSAMAISKYERDINNPSSEVLTCLAEVLEVRREYFFRTNRQSIEFHISRNYKEINNTKQELIKAKVRDWVEGYFEIESFFPSRQKNNDLPQYNIRSINDVESITEKIRKYWNLGFQPIRNLTNFLEDNGIKIGIISGVDDFQVCTFINKNKPIIILNAGLSGCLQRFVLCQELSFLFLSINNKKISKHIADRFARAFLLPKEMAYFELGTFRTSLVINELFLLQEKYGIPIMEWVNRARELKIINSGVKDSLEKGIYKNNRKDVCPDETPIRMIKLIFLAQSENLISMEKAKELLENPVMQNVLYGY